MAEAPTRFFAYREKKNGYCDSICLDCFRTVCSEQSKADLALKEHSHVCNVADLLVLAEKSVRPRKGLSLGGASEL